MKPVFLHGPAVVSSRKKLSQIKDSFTGEVIIFEKGVDIKDILAQAQSVSMFDENRLVVVENPSDSLPLIEISQQTTISLVVWNSSEVDLKKIPQGFDVQFFSEEKEASIFPLLDLLGSKNPKAFLELNNTRPAGTDTQYLITMIFYLLRSLVVTPKNAPSFVKQKISKQRANFSDLELTGLYKFVLETDFKIKTGLMEPQQADFLIINKFISDSS